MTQVYVAPEYGANQPAPAATPEDVFDRLQKDLQSYSQSILTQVQKDMDAMVGKAAAAAESFRRGATNGHA